MKEFKVDLHDPKSPSEATVMELTLPNADAEKYFSSLKSNDSHKFTIKCESMGFDLCMGLVSVEHTLSHIMTEQYIKLTFLSMKG